MKNMYGTTTENEEEGVLREESMGALRGANRAG
jgi:hypothetical protein